MMNQKIHIHKKTETKEIVITQSYKAILDSRLVLICKPYLTGNGKTFSNKNWNV